MFRRTATTVNRDGSKSYTSPSESHSSVKTRIFLGKKYTILNLISKGLGKFYYLHNIKDLSYRRTRKGFFIWLRHNKKTSCNKRNSDAYITNCRLRQYHIEPIMVQDFFNTYEARRLDGIG